jgi:hypothetical protein
MRKVNRRRTPSDGKKGIGSEVLNSTHLLNKTVAKTYAYIEVLKI